MSDVQQGSDWWLASDGKWYPPGPSGVPGLGPASGSAPTVVPSVQGTPSPDRGYAQQQMAGYPGGPIYGPPPYQAKTSVVAVLSLVFSIVWIAGVGSLVAVVLGIAGLVRIGRSQGRLQGKALAVIGLVMGIFGVCATTATAIVGIEVWHVSTTPHIEPLGKQVHLGWLDLPEGIDKVTVTAINPDAGGISATGTPQAPPPGNRFVSVLMTVCMPSLSTSAGGTSTVSFSTLSDAIPHFFVATSNGDLHEAVSTSTGRPDLYDGNAPAVSGCETGFLTFVVPTSEKAVSLRYDPFVLTKYEWRMPQS